METKLKVSADKAFKKEQKALEASEAWREHVAGQAHINANMTRLRNERLARETPPETQGEITKPKKLGRKSKSQNAGDRP
jgi:hypothetical protein